MRRHIIPTCNNKRDIIIGFDPSSSGTSPFFLHVYEWDKGGRPTVWEDFRTVDALEFAVKRHAPNGIPATIRSALLVESG